MTKEQYAQAKPIMEELEKAEQLLKAANYIGDSRDDIDEDDAAGLIALGTLGKKNLKPTPVPAGQEAKAIEAARYIGRIQLEFKNEKIGIDMKVEEESVLKIKDILISQCQYSVNRLTEQLKNI